MDKKYGFSNKEYIDNLLKHNEDYFKEILSYIKECNLPLKSKILDYGCGSGNLVYILSQKGYSNTVGVDIDTDSIEAGKKIGITNIYQLSEYDFENKYFDLIVCNDVLEHIENPKPFLDNLMSYSKENTIMIIKTPNYLNPMGYISYIQSKISRKKLHLTPFNEGGIFKSVYYFILSSLMVILKLIFKNNTIIKVAPISPNLSVGGDADAVWMSNYLDIKNHLFKKYDIKELDNKSFKKKISSNIFVGKVLSK